MITSNCNYEKLDLWQKIAIRKHTAWAKNQNQNYLLVDNNHPKVKLINNIVEKVYPSLLNQWHFKLLLKFIGVFDFVESKEENYLFIDLDLIPINNPSIDYYLKKNFIIIWNKNFHLKNNDGHALFKFIFHEETLNQNPYFEICTCIFSLDKTQANKIVNLLNQKYEFFTENWWIDYKQTTECFQKINEKFFISEESYLQKWINQGLIHFDNVNSEKVINLGLKDINKKTEFIHYWNNRKQLICKNEIGFKIFI